MPCRRTKTYLRSSDSLDSHGPYGGRVVALVRPDAPDRHIGISISIS